VEVKLDWAARARTADAKTATIRTRMNQGKTQTSFTGV